MKPLAIKDGKVCPWLKSDETMAFGPVALPMTIVTAIVSPTALPKPKMIAPKIPERP
jgi:hypothetical protein